VKMCWFPNSWQQGVGEVSKNVMSTQFERLVLQILQRPHWT
jgi:hypothetical protein